MATLPPLGSPRVTHGALITEAFYFEPGRAAYPAVVQTGRLQDITGWWESAAQTVV